MISISAIAVFVGFSIAIQLAIVALLIVSQWPIKTMSARGGLDFSGVASAEPQPGAQRETLTARDGENLMFSRYEQPDAKTGVTRALVILLHGSGWHGAQFHSLAHRLSFNADVIVPDLRGHGTNPSKRGDVDHIGQLEQDICDLIQATQKSGQKVVLAGHSSGGGLVVRFAGGPYGDMIDRAVLLAPFLKYNAPTTRPNSGGWARPLTRRIIGLTMLNAIGFRALNWLTVIQFAFPQSVLDGPLGATATRAYSYRLNASYAPRSAYLKDIAKLPPFLLLAGTADEAFFADKYRDTMQAASNRGTYQLSSGIGHLGIVNDPDTATAIAEFISGLVE